MKKVKVEDLKKSFGEVEALKGVDLDVEEGEIVGFLGPNGAGKSTTVEILTGQRDRDSGDVDVLGMDPGEEGVELRKKLGVLPEREDPPSFMKAREYLEFVADIRDEEIDIEHWVGKFRMEGKMESLSRSLSKGERQKLMIVQALFHDPELVFIDEPLINLDPVIQEEAKQLFRDYREDGGTMFLCTHVVSLAEELCDRVFFLRDGEVIDEFEDTENLKDKFLDDYDY
ncbi:MAG: ABC transporter ATP-binding protein [Candidatus Nanohaloarchaea archaeon]